MFLRLPRISAAVYLFKFIQVVPWHGQFNDLCTYCSVVVHSCAETCWDRNAKTMLNQLLRAGSHSEPSGHSHIRSCKELWANVLLQSLFRRLRLHSNMHISLLYRRWTVCEKSNMSYVICSFHKTVGIKDLLLQARFRSEHPMDTLQSHELTGKLWMAG